MPGDHLYATYLSFLESCYNVHLYLQIFLSLKSTIQRLTIHMIKVELHFRNGRRQPFLIALADVKFEDFVSVLSESQSVNK